MLFATISGHVGRDAELRDAPSGDQVLNFSIAVSRKSRDSEKTIWVDCAIWGKRADALAPYILKGTSLTVVGPLDTREFQKRDGSAGFALTCRVQELTFGGKGERREESASHETRPAFAHTPTATAVTSDAPFEDQIPF